MQASANYERLIEGLSEALSTITDHVAECQVELELYDTPEMREAIANLYAEIFLLLSDLVDYLTKKRLKRLLGSFNEDLCGKYEGEIGNINKKAKKIQRLAEQGSRAELRAMRLQIENLQQDIIVGREGEARRQAEIIAAASRMEAEQVEMMRRREIATQKKIWERLAGNMNRMLGDEALQAVVDIRAANQAGLQGSTLPIGYLTSMTTLSQSATVGPPKLVVMADDVLLHSKQFEDFFDRGRVRLPGRMQMRPVMQTEQIIRRLSDWAKGPPSILWLEGPASPPRDEHNPLSTIAARVVDLADQGSVPVISYFCHLPRGEKLRQGNASTREQASVALITALTRQAMELLLPHFETSFNLSEVRLSLVNGTLDSLPETLRLLGDVLKILNMQLLCVVDGLHWLDDRSTNNILFELVETLRNSSTKLLFTTTGRSACLQQGVSRMEKLTIESLNARGSDVRLSGQTLALQDKGP
ncbi:hypothetical protein PG985_011855 [Apiospora marii]|uniref:uncharacterized protein n=1 Tax=Apiospora marii TaxID=335849 RepID=UPI00312FABD8